MIICGLDPGTEKSGYVVYNSREKQIINKGITNNHTVKHRLGIGFMPSNLLAIEMIDSFGMPVGQETFETLIWIGRFIEAHSFKEDGHILIGRRTVKMHFCNSMKAKDANIRQALIDRFGGKEKAIGLKKTPGPLYGVHDHEWPALAVAVMASDNYGRDNGKK